jgi:hypothetical protein
MPMFIAVHKWSAQDDITVMKETNNAMRSKLPEGVELCFTYFAPPELHRAFCVWVAPNKETLEKVFTIMPVLRRGTEFVPVCQAVPPTLEYELVLGDMIIKGAPK